MNKYVISLEVKAEVTAFDQEDAVEYIHDIFGTDDEVKTVKVIKVEKIN
jgi:hypothetical protein